MESAVLYADGTIGRLMPWEQAVQTMEVNQWLPIKRAVSVISKGDRVVVDKSAPDCPYITGEEYEFNDALIEYAKTGDATLMIK